MGCFLIGVTGDYTIDGEAILGSVSDDPYDVRTFVRSIHPREGLAHIGTELSTTRAPSFTERGYFCQDGDTSRGINAAGLSFTCAIIFENCADIKKHFPVSFSSLIKQLMNTCRNVEEAISLFQNAKTVNPAFSVFLADRHGNIAHIETGSFGTTIVAHYSKEKPGVILAVNCYQSQQFIAHNDPKAVPKNRKNNNGWRLQRGQEFCKQWKGKIDIRAISQILSDHANREIDPKTNPLLDAWGFSICNHGTNHNNSTSPPSPWGTVSAEILQSCSRTLHYCYGWPCGEKPEFNDQLYQENSWGLFHPFTIRDDAKVGATHIFTNLEGKIV